MQLSSKMCVSMESFLRVFPSRMAASGKKLIAFENVSSDPEMSNRMLL